MKMFEIVAGLPIPYRVEYPYGTPDDSFRRNAPENKSTCAAYYKAVPIELLAKLPAGNELRYDTAELVADMQQNGWKYPPGRGGQDILVYVKADGSPYIAEGNHRLSAALQAGLPVVPVQVKYFGRSDEQHLLWPFDYRDPNIRVISESVIKEGLPQGGKLYHGTDVMAAARILYSDEIKGITDHMISGTRSPPGVSLTRSFRFAVDWKGGAGVVFELDGSRLRANHKLIPQDYYNDRREAEEFLIGSIKPVSAVLTAIYMDESTRDYCIEHDEDLIEGHKDYEGLLAHPLLKVMRFQSPVPYYNPRKPGMGMFGNMKEAALNPVELPPEVAQAFDQVGEMQRGEPELLMVQAQKIIGGGLLSYALEHTGDIIHRVTRQGGLMRWGTDEAAIKIDRMYKMLTHPYGFEKEVEEQLRNNAAEKQIPEATYQRQVNAILRRYSEAHEKYPVYNFVQLAAQQAAVTLGMRSYTTTVQWLDSLRHKAKDPQTWLAAVTEYKLNENGYLLTFPYKGKYR